MNLPTTLLSLILAIAPGVLAIDPIYETNTTTYPNISFSLTPAEFLSIPGSNGTSSILASSLSSPGMNISYPFLIAVRDLGNAKKPHFSTTQTLVWLNASGSSGSGSGFESQKVMEGWRNCVVFLGNVSQSAKEEGKNDDGSCGATLGSACVNDLKDVLKDEGTDRCALRFENLPTSCEGRISVLEKGDLTVAELSYNNESYYPLLEVQTPMHRWDDPTFLQNASERVWPVLWYQSLNQAGVELFNTSFGNATFKSMGCLRATTRNNGTTSDANALMGMGHEQWWATVMGLAIWTAWNIS